MKNAITQRSDGLETEILSLSYYQDKLMRFIQRDPTPEQKFTAEVSLEAIEAQIVRASTELKRLRKILDSDLPKHKPIRRPEVKLVRFLGIS